MIAENYESQVPQDIAEGRNLQRNFESKVPIGKNANDFSSQQQDDIWLTVEQVRNLLNISSRAVRKAIQSAKIEGGKYEKLVAKKERGFYEILLSSLPIKIQTKYFREIIAKHTSKSDLNESANELKKKSKKQTSGIQTFSAYSFSEEDHEFYLNLIEVNRKKVDKYITIFKAVEEVGIKGSRKKIEAFFKNVWNKEHPELTCAYKTYNTNERAYRQHGIKGIAGDYGKCKGRTVVLDPWFADFTAAYLKAGAPTIKSCWIIAMGAAMKRKEITYAKEFPARSSFKNRLDREIPKQAQYFARHGEHFWNKKHGAYIPRDDSNLSCNEMWVGDHGQLDIMVEMPDGRIVRPWITVWADQKSGKWVTYDIHDDAPNSDHIFITTKRGIQKYGAPFHWYMDNGKDYRCYDLAGGRTFHKVSVDATKATSLISMLGTVAHYAIPRNAQAKFVERTFKEHRDWFDKHMPAYTGNNTVNRPESLNNDLKKGKLMKFDEFKDLCTTFIEEVLNVKIYESGKRAGYSPNMIWAEENPVKREVPEHILAFLCMRTSRAVSVQRNWITDPDLGLHYYGEWMVAWEGTKKKVHLRRDLEDYGTAWCFDAGSGEFLGKAELVSDVPTLAETKKDKKSLKEQSKRKAHVRKTVKDYSTADTTISPQDKTDNMATALRKIEEEAMLEKGIEQKEQPVVRLATDADRVLKDIKDKEDLKATGTEGVEALRETVPEKKKGLSTDDVLKLLLQRD